MRDRLIELIAKSNLVLVDGGIHPDTHQAQEALADYLLANGVVVPSNKPLPMIDEGDRVLCPICETDLMGCYFGYEESPTVVTCYGCGAWIDSRKAVDREEAEAAVERSENGK